jgi:hypothetical protein
MREDQVQFVGVFGTRIVSSVCSVSAVVNRVELNRLPLIQLHELVNSVDAALFTNILAPATVTKLRFPRNREIRNHPTRHNRYFSRNNLVWNNAKA